jgi:magnesium transporter
MSEDLENIKDSLNEVEKYVFLGHERKMVIALSELSRELIDFKQSARLHKEVFESFSIVPVDFFGKTFESFIEDLRLEYSSVHELIISNRELLNDLRDTNDSLLSTKQNENLKLFSILAFVTFPLALFLDLFTLPTTHTPIIGLAYDWEILTGIVVISGIGMFYFFKKKGWL